MKRLILLLLLLPACGRPEIDSELEPYVKAFERESGLIIASDVKFKELNSNLVGLCQPDFIRNSVWVDPRAWAEAEDNEPARELIVFHELGHCELSREHDNRVDHEGDPHSIMFKGPLSSMVEPYIRDREAYIDELFRR